MTKNGEVRLATEQTAVFVWDLLQGQAAERMSSLVLGVPLKFIFLPGK